MSTDAPNSNTAAKKPPALVLPTISCPLICEQGPSMPSSPTGITFDGNLLSADLMTRIHMFSSQIDSARLSPNYATSDLGSSARSSFSTSSSWMAYRDRSVDFDKDLISPFECDTACSVSPSFSLSPNSNQHFSFDARSVSSLSHNLLQVGGAFELSRERSRSESDMIPKDELSHSSLSVPCYGKKSTMILNKYNQERSSSTPPPTTSERDEISERRATSRLETKEEVDAANLLVNNWAKNQLFAQLQQYTNMLQAPAPPPPILTPTAAKSLKSPTPKKIGAADELAYTCQLCGQAFAVHDRLAKHIASRHRQRSCTLDDASKIHKCGQCSKSFSRSDMLTRHMRLHTGAKPYSCPTCAQVFSRSDHLSTHLRTHTGEKPYACPLCNYSASRRDMISRHMRTHSDTQLDVSTPISQLSIRSATTSPLPPKIASTTIEIGSGELSAFKPINPK
ncbi:unnamed protein product [Caenorhabditis angaria]|uniref:C2H2-type domain-containing protein n=1 Tax=Caenorhabditis angaria TaxID=860376 RepID=A0A9P1I815_9PELO|nr:unnamed protein product [Caenorhabditis angaria]